MISKFLWSYVFKLDVGDKDDASMYEIAAQLQKQVSKGTAKPKYDASQKQQDIV